VIFREVLIKSSLRGAPLAASIVWRDAEIQNLFLVQSAGLPRFARNDGLMNKSVLF
jgi:hypothetical protein